MIYLLPFVAALIGWLTNFLAIKMLFHPKEKMRILGLEIQGIFPKRKDILAEKLGKIVSTELFSISDIKQTLLEPENLESTKDPIEKKIDDFINVRLGEEMPMLSMFLNNNVKSQIKETLLTEFNNAVPEIITNYADRIEERVDIEKIVYDKVKNFSSDKLEEILYSIMKKEFKFIEILGGVLGFIIGLIQLGLVYLQF